MCVVTQQYSIYSKTATFFEKNGGKTYLWLAVAPATWYNYNINNGNEKIESKVWFICGSGENFALQSEKLISNAALLPIHKRVYQGKGHAEVLSQHPEEIVDIIKKCL